MAEPFDDYELGNVRAYLAGEHDETPIAASVAKRLLATLDAQRERHIGVLYDLHKRGVFALDRQAFGRWLIERRDTPEARFAYVALASLDGPETEALIAASPGFAERVRATARRLAAEHYPEGSKLRELAEQGVVTPARSRDPEGIEAVRAMVRAAAEKPAEEPSDD